MLFSTVEPPCYRVLLFSPIGPRRITATLSVRDLARIQVSTIYDGRTRSYTFEPDEDLNSKEDWRDVSLEALGEAERSCRVGDERRFWPGAARLRTRASTGS